MYSGTNTYSASGIAGKKVLSFTPLSSTDLPLIFPGQAVELVAIANQQAIPSGAKVSKIKGNSITLTKSLTANVSGAVKFSGTVPVDSTSYLKVFAVSCGTNTLTPFMIWPENISLRERSDDSEREYESNRSSLTIKWKVSKTQQLGCYNLVARFSPTKGQISGPLVVQSSDLKNLANINVVQRNKGKD